MIKKDLIVRNSKILGGIPTIKGTRIPVSLLKRLIKVGYPDKVITYEYPSLSREKILAFRKMLENQANVSQTK
ncbi:MAG: DUF433 domain-containing protein [Patescibacteria group bacterium]